MNLRVISGRHGGRKLSAPPGRRTHPMSERARGALFNSLGLAVADANVLDTFAGTGALGIEALSRGAAQATFIEKDRQAVTHLRANILALGLEPAAKVVQAPVSSWIDTYQGDLYDLILADPPYYNPQLSTVHKLFGLLKPGGTMILSHPGKGEVPIQNGIVVVDNRSYGNLHLTRFRLDA